MEWRLSWCDKSNFFILRQILKLVRGCTINDCTNEIDLRIDWFLVRIFVVRTYGSTYRTVVPYVRTCPSGRTLSQSVVRASPSRRPYPSAIKLQFAISKKRVSVFCMKEEIEKCGGIDNVRLFDLCHCNLGGRMLGLWWAVERNAHCTTCLLEAGAWDAWLWAVDTCH